MLLALCITSPLETIGHVIIDYDTLIFRFYICD